jgi:coenzyme PQQ precursor peptide PqqA
MLLVRLMRGYRKCNWNLLFIATRQSPVVKLPNCQSLEEPMKTWSKPEVREQEVGLEVTSYLPAEIDVI